MVGDSSVRRRVSPDRRDSFGHLSRQCEEVKEHCRTRRKAMRVFFIAPSMLLLVSAFRIDFAIAVPSLDESDTTLCILVFRLGH